MWHNLIKNVIAVATILILTSCQSNNRDAMLVESYQHSMPSVITIYGNVPDRWGNIEYRGIGTGFFVNKEYILTVFHVIETGTNFNILFWNKTIVKVKVYAIDPQNDLAILRIDADKNEMKFYDILDINFETNPQIGESVFVIGSPFLFDGTMSAGILSRRATRTSSPLWDCDVYLVDAVVEGGSSGSPVFDMEFGLVGIVTGCYGKITIVIPSYSICSFLREHKISRS